MMKPGKLENRLGMIPSLYGIVAWGISIILFEINLFNFQSMSQIASVLIVFTVLLFASTTLVIVPLFFRVGTLPATKNPPSLKSIVILHAIGFAGLVLAIVHAVTAMGGLGVYFHSMLDNPGAIRQLYTDITGTGSPSIGIQMSYFGWVAIWLSIFRIISLKLHSEKWFLYGLMMCQFLGNLFMIDRTRPFWILFVLIWLILFASPQVMRLRSLVMYAAIAVAIFLAIFISVAHWTGKTVENNPSINAVSSSPLVMPYVYATSGIAYFNYITKYEAINYSLERSMYPLYMLLSKFEIASKPPSQINTFYNVPFPANVGTFLEPYYRDGGLLLCLLAILIHTVGFDVFAICALRTTHPMAIILVGNLCFIDVMSSFTPKANSSAIWLIVGITILMILCGKIGFKMARYERKLRWE